MNEAMDLIDQAAAGSSAAQVGLAEQAMQFATSSVGREIEALSAAETWARLAAARGGIEENRILAGILLARVHFAVSQGDLQTSAWFEGETRRVLQLLVAMGDADAPAWLQDLGPGGGDAHDAPNMVFQSHLIAAAGGDPEAAGRLFDETLRLLNSRQYDEVEALTVGEVYARLGRGHR